jgi:ABC-type amino acid transport substrate-binding protein
MNGIDRVTICVDRLHPPYVYEKYGDLRGVTVELVRAAFAARGIEAALYPTDGPMAQVVHLSAGRADLAADITITEQRRRWFVFSDPYIVEELQILMLRRGPVWPGWSHFSGCVGVKVASYAMEHLLRFQRRARLVSMESTERLLKALVDQQVDAAVVSRVSAEALTSGSGRAEIGARGSPFAPAAVALAALPGREALLEEFNRGLAVVGGGLNYLALLSSAARLRSA